MGKVHLARLQCPLRPGRCSWWSRRSLHPWIQAAGRLCQGSEGCGAKLEWALYERVVAHATCCLCSQESEVGGGLNQLGWFIAPGDDLAAQGERAPALRPEEDLSGGEGGLLGRQCL